MYYENSNHYQPILNLIGASGTRGYCIPCNKSYWHVEDHRCTNKCSKCLLSQPCTAFGNIRKYALCCRTFVNEDCFENHLKRGSYNKNNSVCDKIKLCQKCFKIVLEKNRRSVKHECGVSYCGTCKLRLPVGHLCYIQPIKLNETVREVLFLFYDFETQQTMPVLGDEERKIHVPNLCVVQQTCSHCLDINNVSIRCNHCGVREYVFKDELVKQLIDLALTPRQKFKKIVCIAHNT